MNSWPLSHLPDPMDSVIAPELLDLNPPLADITTPAVLPGLVHGDHTSPTSSTASSALSTDSPYKPRRANRARKPRKSPKQSPTGTQAETHDESRRERNRIAASKCRQKKKRMHVSLEERMESLQANNARLKAQTGLLWRDLQELRMAATSHAACSDACAPLKAFSQTNVISDKRGQVPPWGFDASSTLHA